MPFRLFAMLALTALTAGISHADELAFSGTWEITGGVHAPWEDPAHPIVLQDEARFNGKDVVIAPGKITGPDAILGCGKTRITLENMPFAGLFEGGLTVVNPGNPAGPFDEKKARKAALDLGFTAEPVVTLFHDCSEIAFHMRDDETLMFALDNRIYTMKRK